MNEIKTDPNDRESKHIITEGQQKEIIDMIAKKSWKYYLLVSLPSTICVLSLFSGVKSNNENYLVTSMALSFTMLGITIGLYSSHESTKALILYTIPPFITPGMAKERISDFYKMDAYAFMDIMLIITYFILGLLSVLYQA